MCGIADGGAHQSPVDGELGASQQEVGISHLFHGVYECLCPGVQLVGEAQADFVLDIALLCQQVADAHRVTASGLQGVEFAAQRG